MLFININYFQMKCPMTALPFELRRMKAHYDPQAYNQSPHSGHRRPLWHNPRGPTGQQEAYAHLMTATSARSRIELDTGWANRIHARDPKSSELRPSNGCAPLGGRQSAQALKLKQPSGKVYFLSHCPKPLQILPLLIHITTLWSGYC